MHEALSRGTVARSRDAHLLFARIVRALAFAHSRGVFHGELRASDILLAPDGSPKVSGFSVFAPPADAATARAAAASDAYACGTMLADLLPLRSQPQVARDLAKKLTHPDPNARPSLAATVKHPWLAAADRPLALPPPPSSQAVEATQRDPPSPPPQAPLRKDVYPDHVPLMSTMQATTPGGLSPTEPPLVLPVTPPQQGAYRRKARQSRRAKKMLIEQPMSPVTPPPPPRVNSHASSSEDEERGPLERLLCDILPARFRKRTKVLATMVASAGVDDEDDLQFVLKCEGGVCALAAWLERTTRISAFISLRIAAGVEKLTNK